jgi:4-hydroxy-tetrahydrodipicolinate synthase
MIPALKACIAHYAADPDWVTVRPPLVEQALEERAKMVSELLAAGFDMPGIKQ